MESIVEDLLKKFQGPEIKKVTVIKGKELEEKGMNLHYNVGKGASDEPRCVVIHY